MPEVDSRLPTCRTTTPSSPGAQAHNRRRGRVGGRRRAQNRGCRESVGRAGRDRVERRRRAEAAGSARRGRKWPFALSGPAQRGGRRRAPKSGPQRVSGGAPTARRRPSSRPEVGAARPRPRGLSLWLDPRPAACGGETPFPGDTPSRPHPLDFRCGGRGCAARLPNEASLHSLSGTLSHL